MGVSDFFRDLWHIKNILIVILTPCVLLFFQHVVLEIDDSPVSDLLIHLNVLPILTECETVIDWALDCVFCLLNWPLITVKRIRLWVEIKHWAPTAIYDCFLKYGGQVKQLIIKLIEISLSLHTIVPYISVYSLSRNKCHSPMLGYYL